jgi:hypothetical protein
VQIYKNIGLRLKKEAVSNPDFTLCPLKGALNKNLIINKFRKAGFRGNE